MRNWIRDTIGGLIFALMLYGVRLLFSRESFQTFVFLTLGILFWQIVVIRFLDE